MTNPSVYAKPLEKNILEWHYVIEGSSETPFEGGYYWGKLIFPKEYPLKPPSVIMLTPNGRFKTGRRLCLSMSDFHPESWNPMWSVSTIISGLISFMVETAPTLGSIETSDDQKRKYARLSLDFNAKEPIFFKLFPELKLVHEERLKQRENIGGASAVADINKELSKLSHNNDASEDFQGFLAAAAGIVVLSILVALRFF
eukprot:CAMPEP_0184863300 /NCGR_PEP_ID=MMETSP0580-20130426/10494_1 /TAXON_ID=1118495 /ORGANISM="Dactyliosolen fragilissimus" /LENGTH=199 /DNA_ID=CAMNT_0027361557 /DNA_START=103 /DNA_END=702 /DNA_ORIENTATION=+